MTCTIAYTSPFIPPEWIAAHGLLPQRLILDRATAPAGAGVCPFASALADHICTSPRDTAFLLTTTCDQMRRIAEHLSADASRIFSFNVPATWQSASSMELYIAELHRLSRFLCRLGGSSPAPAHLAAIMKEHDARRHPSRIPSSANSNPRIPLALVGGPLRQQDHWLLDCI
ncbi:MAG TPA: 2-hydroxyacyl-CoA dehydratase family protein, partial [Tepidisphaeraceae bacterium]|nr:2-hydroxyacyl-CoA dehydratase family protein [Tepidisphaeraceae bacterium]